MILTQKNYRNHSVTPDVPDYGNRYSLPTETDPSKYLLGLLHCDHDKSSPKAASESARTESTMTSSSESAYSDDLDRYLEEQKETLKLGLQKALIEEHGDGVDRQVLDQACHELVERTFSEVEAARGRGRDPGTNRYMKRPEDPSD